MVVLKVWTNDPHQNLLKRTLTCRSLNQMLRTGGGHYIFAISLGIHMQTEV